MSNLLSLSITIHIDSVIDLAPYFYQSYIEFKTSRGGNLGGIRSPLAIGY